MSYVIFENPGVIDQRAIRMFGCSVKETDNPIGFFGTGLKYSLAILAREKCPVVILAGLDRLNISAKTVTMRGKDFESVTANGEDLPYTTELGKNWEIWQAFRELYCNALDEGGKCYLADDIPAPREGHTVVAVAGTKFHAIYFERNSIVLDPPEHLKLVSEEAEVYNHPSEYLYYRKIRVMKLDPPALLTYNITAQCDLTEDRTLKHPGYDAMKLPRAIAKITDREVTRRVLTAAEDTYEARMDFSALSFMCAESSTSEEFREVLEREWAFNNDHLNTSARAYHAKLVNKAVLKNYVPTELTPVEKKQLDRCSSICEKLFPDFNDFPIVTVKDLGQTTMAHADLTERRMVISRRCYGMGTKYLLATLIEEYTHLKTGHRDNTREMQTHLFDTICTLVENHVLGEPI